MPDGQASLIGAESIIKSLVASGPWGVLCAILLASLIACFLAWRAAEKDLKAEIRKVSDALHLSTEAMREGNAGRAAIVEAMRESHRLSNEVLGRIERQNSVLDSIDRTVEIAYRSAALDPRRGGA